jgi:hypothetical protein
MSMANLIFASSKTFWRRFTSALWSMDQLATVAREIAKVANLDGRDEAAPVGVSQQYTTT